MSTKLPVCPALPVEVRKHVLDGKFNIPVKREGVIMNRRSVISSVLAFVVSMFVILPTLAADAIVPEPGISKPASPGQIESVANTLDVWASRVSRQDSRALAMMAPETYVPMFSAVDQTTAERMFGMKFPTEILTITDVMIQEDNTLVARVSYTGFNARYAFATTDFTFADQGGKYLQIVGATLVEPVLPQGEVISKLTLTFDAQGQLSISDASIDQGTYTAITVRNSSAGAHIVAVIKHGVDPNDPTKIDGVGMSTPNVDTSIIMSGLPAGKYDVVDGVTPVIQFTVK